MADAFGAIIPLAGERSAYASISHWTSEDGRIEERDIDWGVLGYGEFHGFAEALLNTGNGAVAARSWQDSDITTTSLIARMQHQLVWGGVLDPKANTRAETYPGFVLEFELIEPAQAEFQVGGYTLGGAYVYLEVAAGLYAGALEDQYEGPQFWYRSSGSSGNAGGAVLDLPAGVYTCISPCSVIRR